MKNWSTTTRVVVGLGVAFFAVVVMLVLWAIVSYISANNYAGPMEKSIEAKSKASQSVFSNYGQKVMEAAQVPAMYKDDLTQVMKAAITARYGEEGSKATMQWLKEANIPFDSSIYKNLQQIIEAGRDDFQRSQIELLDSCRQYQGEITKIPRGWFIKLAGYPTIDMKICQAVTDDRTEKAFSTGKQETLQLRKE